MQFCQVLFLNNYICDTFVVDKIEIGVYNVHRNPRGAFTPILDLFLEVPPRVFPGILSEYNPRNMVRNRLTRDSEIFWCWYIYYIYGWV